MHAVGAGEGKGDSSGVGPFILSGVCLPEWYSGKTIPTVD